MAIWIELLLLVFIFCFNLLASGLFNYKIFLLIKNKYFWAGLFGGIGTFLNALFIGIISLNALNGWPIWFSAIEIIVLGTASALSVLIIPITEKALAKRRFLKEKES